MKEAILSFYGIKGITPLPVGFEQGLLFSLKIEEKGEGYRPLVDSIERNVRVVYLGKRDDVYVFQVFCLLASFDLCYKRAPKTEILRRTSYAWDELVLSANEQGQLTQILNFPFVQQRWRQVRKKLYEQYGEEEIGEYMASLDTLFQDQEELLAYLQSPAVYGLYFNGYWGDYTAKDSRILPLFLGLETKGANVQETVSFRLLSSKPQQRVQFLIKGEALEETQDVKSYRAKCQYLDGVLDYHHKTLEIENKKINYSVQWAGLKKRAL